MSFLRARSEEEIVSRQDEILAAGETLFQRSGYNGVNFKAISDLTTFTRPTIYNYYKNKDEVLLALLQRELVSWKAEFTAKIAAVDCMTGEDYCRYLTQSVKPHPNLFRLLAFLFSSMEDNCRLENLRDFYGVVQEAFVCIDTSVDRFFPLASQRSRRDFRFQVVALCLGLHTMTSLSDKQTAALREIGAIDEIPAFSELFSQGVLTLLTAMERKC